MCWRDTSPLVEPGTDLTSARQLENQRPAHEGGLSECQQLRERRIDARGLAGIRLGQTAQRLAARENSENRAGGTAREVSGVNRR